ncbi:MAG TPA: glycoside hydrolase family 43 protein [Acidimicrobiales bacterium]|nr:glycoside hydrolase family 43 protein [Acidimicrobiales bacterium]
MVSPPGIDTNRRRPPLAVLRSLLASCVVLGAAAVLSAGAPAASADNWSPVHPGDFPDPSILYVPGSLGSPGTYYGFATQNFAAPSQTINIQVSTSTDGVNWTQLNGVDALPRLGSWAKEGETWAPSVVYNAQDTDYVMYYTATEAWSGDQCIGMATSLTPMGPYTDTSGSPAVCQDGSDFNNAGTLVDNGNYGGSIDPDVFMDPATGDASLIWKADSNHLGAGATTIWSVPLTSDLVPVANTTPVPLLTASQTNWQSGIVEGPDMVATQTTTGTPPHTTTTDNYYLFYAGSDEGASTYGLGWATCSGPSGPCSDQSTSGPLLASEPGMSGPGGPDVYSLPAVGSSPPQLVMAFAAWQGTTVGYLSCGIRPMYLADLSFGGNDNGPPTLSANDPGESPASNPSCPGRPALPPGYWQVAADGGVFTFGSAGFYGSTGSIRLNKPVVGMAPTPDRRGYWLVASDGGVFAYGDAWFYGSTGSMILNKPIIGMIPTINGQGYWLIASDGGVFAFGNAPFYGSAGGDGLAYPVTGAAPSFLGGGYWLVDANGQVFNYGNAPFEGQPVFAPGGYRITGLAGTRDSSGYWLASANGNVADFGDAAPYGSMIGTNLNAPIVGMAATHDGAGYWLQGSDGGIFTFGDAPFFGSMGGHRLNAPMVGIAAV